MHHVFYRSSEEHIPALGLSRCHDGFTQGRTPWNCLCTNLGRYILPLVIDPTNEGTLKRWVRDLTKFARGLEVHDFGQGKWPSILTFGPEVSDEAFDIAEIVQCLTEISNPMVPKSSPKSCSCRPKGQPH
jgi:hypothetical protein